MRERTGGRGKLGAYACDINIKVEVSANWGSSVLNTSQGTVLLFPPKNFNSGISRNPNELVELEERYSPLQDEWKTFRREKNAREIFKLREINVKSVTETQKKPINSIFLSKYTLSAVTQLFKSP